MDVEALLRQPVAAEVLEVSLKTVIARARSVQLRTDSLIVLVALMRMCGKGGSAHTRPAHDLLHCGAKFSRRDAFNAISDQRALEILAVSETMLASRVVYCSDDKAAADLWRSLAMRVVEKSGQRYLATCELSSELFPRLSPEQVVWLGTLLR